MSLLSRIMRKPKAPDPLVGIWQLERTEDPEGDRDVEIQFYPNGQIQYSILAGARDLPLILFGKAVPGKHRRSVRFVALVSFEPRPGTVAFLGYGSGQSDEVSPVRELERVNDGFFFKLAYQFRR